MKKTLLTFLFLILAIIGKSQAGDCPGVTICTNTTATVVNGTVDNELNLAYSGCLPTGESPNKSRWYQFCVTTSGTIRFTINRANDYDWALWGPNSTCPPTSAPLRCSYAIVSGGSDNTGVNSANNAPQTDLTEGAGGNQWTQDVNAVAGECFVLLINNYGTGSNTFSISWGGTATLLCSALPIELLSFNGENVGSYNELTWIVATETNNDYFTLERSFDGIYWDFVTQVDGAGNSSITTTYSYRDFGFQNGYNYYRLSQTDFNGASESFDVIYVDNSVEPKKVIRVTNMMGQEVSEDFEGLRIIYYSDGTTKKKVGR